MFNIKKRGSTAYISDCRANLFTASNKDPVARSVVRVNYDIEGRVVQGTLTENNAKLVIRI